MNENETGQTWPEQEIIDAWIKRNNLKIKHTILYDLKQAVTKPRIERDKKDEIKNNKLPQTVEIIPNDFPDWAKAAFHQGQFFRVSMSRINELESKLQESLK